MDFNNNHVNQIDINMRAKNAKIRFKHRSTRITSHRFTSTEFMTLRNDSRSNLAIMWLTWGVGMGGINSRVVGPVRAHSCEVKARHS